jgi:hypothetical protein
LTSGVLYDHYYRILEPAALLLLTGLAFAMVGYSLDRIFNPRLRSMQSGPNRVPARLTPPSRGSIMPSSFATATSP